VEELICTPKFSAATDDYTHQAAIAIAQAEKAKKKLEKRLARQVCVTHSAYEYVTCVY